MAERNGKDKTYIVRTMAEVGAFFGLAPRSIYAWREQGMPGSEGEYDLSAIARWDHARMTDALRTRVEASDLEEQKLEQEIRWKKLRNDQLEGKLILKDDVEQGFSLAFARIADRMQAVPDEIEMELPQEVKSEVKQRCQNLIAMMLKELSETELSL